MPWVSTNYEQVVSTTYNASAGTPISAITTVAGVIVIFDKFELKQVDGTRIQPEDQKALIPSKAISAITPKVTDRILVSGITWNVVDVVTDPAGALYELQVRRS
jgi:archaellum component FlaF (FlaF/FlaG flagellin family)